MAYKQQTIYNSEYHIWWPPIRDNPVKEFQRLRLVRKYGIAFWNACRCAERRHNFRHHLMWLNTVSRLDVKLDKLCKPTFVDRFLRHRGPYVPSICDIAERERNLVK
jgi:hypothetical protein